MPVLPHDSEANVFGHFRRDALNSRWPVQLRVRLGQQLVNERDDASNRYFLTEGQRRLNEATRQALGRPLGRDRR